MKKYKGLFYYTNRIYNLFSDDIQHKKDNKKIT